MNSRPHPIKGCTVFLGKDAPLPGHLPQLSLGDSTARHRTARGPSSPLRHPQGLRTGVSCADAPSVDLGLRASGDPRGSGSPRPVRMHPSASRPRRLSWNFEPCPQALMGSINPIVFKPWPCKLPPQPGCPSPLSGWSATLPGLVRRGIGDPFYRRQMGQGSDLTRDLSLPALFPVRVDASLAPLEAHLIPEAFSPLSDSPPTPTPPARDGSFVQCPGCLLGRAHM